MRPCNRIRRTTAHYLLGTFYFSRGLTDPALLEWGQARRIGPVPPVLSASIGLALLHMKNDPPHALAAFQDGMRSDPTNTAIYLGMDQALSLLKRPARERVEALEKYPQMDSAPPAVIFELILNLAETGDFDRATHLFYNRFFPREEGGTNVRQVWIEVQLLQALSLTKDGRCSEALSAAQHLGSEVPGLAFTRDGLESILRSARTNYLIGTVFAACGHAERPKRSSNSLPRPPRQTKSAGPFWQPAAYRRLTKRNGMIAFNRHSNRLKAGAKLARIRVGGNTLPPLWQGSGQNTEAQIRFRDALLLPDRMLAYHLTRLADSEPAP